MEGLKNQSNEDHNVYLIRREPAPWFHNIPYVTFLIAQGVDRPNTTPIGQERKYKDPQSLKL